MVNKTIVNGKVGEDKSKGYIITYFDPDCEGEEATWNFDTLKEAIDHRDKIAEAWTDFKEIPHIDTTHNDNLNQLNRHRSLDADPEPGNWYNGQILRAFIQAMFVTQRAPSPEDLEEIVQVYSSVPSEMIRKLAFDFEPLEYSPKISSGTSMQDIDPVLSSKR